MRTRPMPVTVAAILMALFSLMNFPGPWWYMLPGAAEEQPPDFVLYSGIALGIVGIVTAIGLWVMQTWSFWATIIVSVLNILLNVTGLVAVSSIALLAAIAVQTVGFLLVIVLVVVPSARRALTAT